MASLEQIIHINHLNINNVVVKANTLIEGHYSMTQPESKIMEAIVSVLSQHAQDFEVMVFSTAELCTFCGINLRELKEVTKSILKQPVVFWDKTSSGEKREVQTAWLTSAIYYPDRGTVEFKVSPDLKPYLLNLSKNNRPFTVIGVNEVMKSTYYTKRIYELAMQYKNVGRRPPMTITELRGCLGIADSKYGKFSHLREKVIDKAISDINEDSKKMYSVDYELIKHGRSISEIVFHIKRKAEKSGLRLNAPFLKKDDPRQTSWALASDEAVEAFLQEKRFETEILEGLDVSQKRSIVQLVDHGMNSIPLRKALLQYGVEHVLNNARIARERYGNGGRNYGAILTTAIRENWANEERIKNNRAMRNSKELDVKKLAASYAELDEREWREKAAIPVKRISAIEIEMVNERIGKKEGRFFIEKTLERYENSSNQRIREAVNLIKSGQKIPVDFFD